MEVWRKVPDWPFISASSLGRIRNNNTGHIYTPRINVGGYQIVRVFIDGKRKHFFVNRLVLMAFKGNPKSPSHVSRHMDGNQINNIPSNLKWGTQAENIADRERHGNTMRGDKHYATTINAKQVVKIRDLIAKGHTSKHVASVFGVKKNVVDDIRGGRSWLSV